MQEIEKHIVLVIEKEFSMLINNPVSAEGCSVFFHEFQMLVVKSFSIQTECVQFPDTLLQIGLRLIAYVQQPHRFKHRVQLFIYLQVHNASVS
ncbi:hypothetical protein D3C75_454150 [compost metagenome]